MKFRHYGEDKQIQKIEATEENKLKIWGDGPAIDGVIYLDQDPCNCCNCDENPPTEPDCFCCPDDETIIVTIEGSISADGVYTFVKTGDRVWTSGDFAEDCNATLHCCDSQGDFPDSPGVPCNGINWSFFNQGDSPFGGPASEPPYLDATYSPGAGNSPEDCESIGNINCGKNVCLGLVTFSYQCGNCYCDIYIAGGVAMDLTGVNEWTGFTGMGDRWQLTTDGLGNWFQTMYDSGMNFLGSYSTTGWDGMGCVNFDAVDSGTIGDEIYPVCCNEPAPIAPLQNFKWESISKVDSSKIINKKPCNCKKVIL